MNVLLRHFATEIYTLRFGIHIQTRSNGWFEVQTEKISQPCADYILCICHSAIRQLLYELNYQLLNAARIPCNQIVVAILDL